MSLISALLSFRVTCFNTIFCQCEISVTKPGDGLDNDCDGKFDEEVQDGLDNDNDGKTDEDLQMVLIFFFII